MSYITHQGSTIVLSFNFFSWLFFIDFCVAEKKIILSCLETVLDCYLVFHYRQHNKGKWKKMWGEIF